jgi:hypothetical protein
MIATFGYHKIDPKEKKKRKEKKDIAQKNMRPQNNQPPCASLIY